MGKESDLAALAVGYLKEQHWKVYQEVAPWGGSGPVCDIVAEQGKIIWAIEVKLILSCKVLEQARKWQAYSNLTSIMIPERTKTCMVRSHFIQHFGIGVLKGVKWAYAHRSVHEFTRPRMNRKPLPNIKNCLCDKMQTYADAGNDEGKYWTVFKQTCEEARRFVSKHEGCTLKQLVDGIEHHYSSDTGARCCLAKWIDTGKIDGIRSEKIDGRWRLFKQ